MLFTSAELALKSMQILGIINEAEDYSASSTSMSNRVFYPYHFSAFGDHMLDLVSKDSI